jgi:hypothetical protein
MPCQRASSVSAYPGEHCEGPQRNRPQVRDARELQSVVGAGADGGGGSARNLRLLENATNWKRAEGLRAFIAAVKAFPSFDRARMPQRTQWLRWARAEADQLDPFAIAPDDVLDVDFEALARLEKLTGDNEG